MNRRDFLAKTIAASGFLMTGGVNSASELIAVENYDSYDIIESAVSYWPIRLLGSRQYPVDTDLESLNKIAIEDFQTGKMYRYGFLNGGSQPSHRIDDIKSLNVLGRNYHQKSMDFLLVKMSPLNNESGREIIKLLRNGRNHFRFIPRLNGTWIHPTPQCKELDFSTLRVVGINIKST